MARVAHIFRGVSDRSLCICEPATKRSLGGDRFHVPRQYSSPLEDDVDVCPKCLHLAGRMLEWGADNKRLLKQGRLPRPIPTDLLCTV